MSSITAERVKHATSIALLVGAAASSFPYIFLEKADHGGDGAVISIGLIIAAILVEVLGPRRRS